ncbi:hypothetical protein AcW1_002208 [Taiwanofungus camphoratus]|nr:hypothetical protein AcV5_010202 [Antrodia cinnamomea]KAI0944523.1 hypothetical protein AcW1_002208 [Antrodia cinnamomea]KAI0946183.1 hypothetical protein AcV7_010222 [Antrodia cinnamomea]
MGEPMITVYNLLLSLGIAASVTILWKLYPCLIHPFTSPFRSIPGPPNPSLLYGNMKDIRDSEDAALHQAWAEKYGITFKYKAFFNYDRLCTMDPRALNHIFSHSFVYQKPELARTNLAQVLGKGLLVVEGDQHRQQRRIMNPAFGPVQIRELTEVFMEKAIQLRDIWSGEIAKSGQFARVDVLSGLSKMTLDVIGLAGFNYQFNALNAEGKPNELNQAVEVMFQANAGFSILGLLKDIFPPLRLIRDKRAKSIAVAQNVMNRIGMQLVAEKKAAILKAPEGKMTGNEKDLHTRDLLTLLIKANMATDIPESQRLSDKDMLARTSPITSDLYQYSLGINTQRSQHSLWRDTRRLATAQRGVSSRSARRRTCSRSCARSSGACLPRTRRWTSSWRCRTSTPSFARPCACTRPSRTPSESRCRMTSSHSINPTPMCTGRCTTTSRSRRTA